MIHNDAMYKAFLPNGPSPGAEDGGRAEVAAILRSFNAMPVPWVDPVDISNAVVFLASDQARYISGSIIPVSAG